MLGSLMLYLKGMRVVMFQLSLNSADASFCSLRCARRVSPHGSRARIPKMGWKKRTSGFPRPPKYPLLIISGV